MHIFWGWWGVKQRQEKKPMSESARGWRSRERGLEQISLAVRPRAGTVTQEAVAGVKMVAGARVKPEVHRREE